MKRTGCGHSSQELVETRQLELSLGPSDEALEVRLVDTADGCLHLLVTFDHSFKMHQGVETHD